MIDILTGTAFDAPKRMNHREDGLTAEFPSSATSRSRGLLALRAQSWRASGGGVKYLEYLECSGTQWVDLGCKWDLTTTMEVSFSIDYDLAARADTNPVVMSRFWDTMALGVTTSAWPASKNSTMTYRNGRTSGSSYTIDKSIQTIRIEPTRILRNGEEVITDWDRWSTTYEANYSRITSFYAFAYGYVGKVQTIAKTGRIYDIVIESDSDSHHFRPALDADGVACFHDDVTGEFFYNSGDGEFLHN